MFMRHVRSNLHVPSLATRYGWHQLNCKDYPWLLDFRKAFDLVDHHILVAKLLSLGVKPTVVNWVIDFLRSRQQRVKLNGVLSNWLDVPPGEPQGTRLGPWLFLAMINDLRLPEGFHMWKFADDTTVSEVVPASKHSSLQQAADYIHDWSQEIIYS